MRAFLASDLEEINAWHVAHGSTPARADRLPACGAIEPGMAAAFLFRTDANVCILEGMVSNPAAPLRKRTAALHAIADHLLALAKGCRVVAICTADGTARTAHKHGFSHPTVAVVLTLEA